MSIALSTRLHTSFEDAVARTREALAAQGFGVLTEIDMQATLKAKLGEEMEPYLILGACNPPLAHRAVSIDRQIGLLLPCNVVVRQDGDQVLVEAVDPMGMMSVAGDDALDAVAGEAADRLQARFPGLTIAGAAPGSPRPEDDPATWEMIRAAGPVDLILVAYGAPAQERWLERSLGPLGIAVGIGVGGVFNFLSGEVPRAPRWARMPCAPPDPRRATACSGRSPRAAWA